MKKTKLSVVILCILCCANSAFCHNQNNNKEPDPYENHTALIESFVVEIPTEALIESGVNPISNAPESISTLKILWCLNDEDKAEIISGAKINCRHRNESRSRNSQRINLPTKQTAVTKGTKDPVYHERVQYVQYSSETKFESYCFIHNDNQLRLEYTYSFSSFSEAQENKQPSTYSFDWSGNLTAQSGKPVIAGAIQNDDSVTFLIITATIQNLD